MLALQKLIRIDGSLGEGGGQMLRTSLSLSLITGQPFEMVNIRAGRNKPGLLRQHLTAVLAAAQIGEAALEGAHLGSQSLTFAPTTIKAGEYRFVIGSAGSGTLVFQTVLPALMLASLASHVTIQGGTHNDAAPAFDYLDKVFLPFIRRMGPKVQLSLDRYGFYPTGGGQFRADITPSRKLDPLYLGTRGQLINRRITSVGQGKVTMLEVECEGVTEMFTSFGDPGVSIETEAEDYLASSAIAGEHLTDQLLLPLALAGKGGFTSTKLTQHAITNMEIIQEFLPVRFHVAEKDNHIEVKVSGA